MLEIAPNLLRLKRPDDPMDFVRENIQVVISFEWGFRGLAAKDAYDNFNFFAHGIDQISIRMSDFFPPTDDEVLEALSIIRVALAEGKRVAIHCLSGKDRTGFIAAVYKMQFEGWSFKKAHAEWVELGRHVWYFWWKWKLMKWEKR